MRDGNLHQTTPMTASPMLWVDVKRRDFAGVLREVLVARNSKAPPCHRNGRRFNHEDRPTAVRDVLPPPPRGDRYVETVQVIAGDLSTV
jgi:hypothetical protein